MSTGATDVMRTAWVGIAVLAAAGSATSNPPPQVTSPQWVGSPAETSPSDPSVPPPTDPSVPPPSDPSLPPPPTSAGVVGGEPAGRWISPASVSYTNAAMTSADVYLEVAVAS